MEECERGGAPTQKKGQAQHDKMALLEDTNHTLQQITSHQAGKKEII